MENKYTFFSNFVLRTPMLSIEVFKELTSEKVISDEKLKKLLESKEIQEAIYISSPVLFNEMTKWLLDEKLEIKKKEKLKISILKYISRMTSRCTPFGLMAGCTLGKFEQHTHIELTDFRNNIRKTRLDMNYLISLAQYLTRVDNIKSQIKFYPNSSIYNLGDYLRYIEYTYINSKRFHHIVEINNSIYIKKILKTSRGGVLLKDLISLLQSEGFDYNSSKEFINELVENQVLVSELEPSVSGIEFEHQIITILEKLNDVGDILDMLKEITIKMVEIDKVIGNDISKYNDLYKHLQKINLGFEKNYLIQTDLFIDTNSHYLNEQIPISVLKAIRILNKINPKIEKNNLIEFKRKFYERFENREIPLSIALDSEIGIPYPSQVNSGGINPLIDDIIFPNKEINSKIEELKWSSFDKLFNDKLIEAVKKADYVITLKENEFNDWKEDWDDLPDTMSTLVEIVKSEGKEKIKFNNIGGASAANLSSRFCYGNNDINEHVKDIVDVESTINKEKIVAEIIHLPESRVGNILMRPSFRDFEIPYLGKSNLSSKNQISLDDLYISIKDNKFFLRKKNSNKEIVPYLTSAHNYSYNSTPIYHFLCDLQNQGKRGGLFFNIINFMKIYNFIPRVEFENVIFFEATWNIHISEIKEILKINDGQLLLLEVFNFRKKRKMPNYVFLTERDNDLVINLSNELSIKTFLNIVKYKDAFVLKEYLFDNDSIIKDANKKAYTNEVLISFYNKYKFDKYKK